MSGRDESKRRTRPAAALFVLFGLLLNVAGATGAQLDRDPRAARLGNSEIVRTAPGTRLASRSDDDRSDHEEVVAGPPPPLRLVALAATSHPAGTSSVIASAARSLGQRAPYQARAPPAA